MQLQTWIENAGHYLACVAQEPAKTKQTHGQLRGPSFAVLSRASALLTAVVGSTFFGLARAQETTANGLTGREVRRVGISPAIISVVPPQSVFPETIFTLSLSPRDYFVDGDFSGFTLSAVEKGQQMLPGWLEFRYENHQVLGTYITPGTPYGLHVVGNFVYVADYGQGLQIINVSNPTAPTLAGTYNTPGIAYDVYVASNFAYVANDSSGLRIIDVSNPAAPTLTGTYDTPGNSRGVHVVGNFAYIADYTFGLQIINVSNSTAPTLTGTYDTPGSAYRVHVVGNFAHVADGNFGLQIIDVSNPAVPTLAGTYNTQGIAYGVHVSGNFAYVADGSSGLRIINVSNPAAPTLTGTYDTPGSAFGVHVLGNLAYVADYTFGLQIIDVSNPASPTLTGNYDTLGLSFAYDVHVANNFAYMGDSTSGVQIYEEQKQFFSILNNTDIGNYEIELIATDPDLNVASSTFVIRVEGPPTAVGSIPNKLANIGDPFNYFINQNVFPDPNNDVVYYSAKQTNQNALPSWLSFSSIGIFSGTPQSSDTGNYNIQVFAYDGIALDQANTTFSLIAEHFPQVTTPISNQAADLDQSYSFTVPSQTFSDQDVGDTLSYSATLASGNPLPSWLNFNSATRHFSGIPTVSDTGSITIKVSATDTPGAVASTTFTLAVGPFPALLNPINNQLVAVRTPYLFAVPGNTFSTPSGESLTYMATKADGSLLPTWLGFVGPRLEFQGTPQLSDKGNIAIKVIAQDTKGGTAESPFSLNVVEALSQEVIRVGGSFVYTIPSDMISTPLGPVIYSADLDDGSTLPPWLTHNTATNAISGVPPSNSEGTYNILVTADDGVQAPVLGRISLTVGTNVAPLVANPLSNQVAQVGQTFRLVVSDNTFADPNGDLLTLSAKRVNGRTLPSWLTFTDRTLEGKPGPGDTGAFNDKSVPIQICATDGDQKGCTVFDLGVQGTSAEEQTLIIFGPLATATGLSIAWYKKRGLLLNPWNREKYDKGTKNISIGQPFSYTLEAPKDNVKVVKAFEGTRMVAGLPSPKALDERGWLEWLKHDKPITGGSLLPDWLIYDTAKNQLASNYSPRPEDAGLYTVRVFGHGEVILEELKLSVGGQGSKDFEMYSM